VTCDQPQGVQRCGRRGVAGGRRAGHRARLLCVEQAASGPAHKQSREAPHTCTSCGRRGHTAAPQQHTPPAHAAARHQLTARGPTRWAAAQSWSRTSGSRA
jgi:hypothetical protein